MDKRPITIEGFKELNKKLENLKKIRPKIINEIEKARSHGDLKENAEYHSAREEQFILESKIKEIEKKISNTIIIDINEICESKEIMFGATVKLTNLDNSSILVYKIVGEDEANIKEKKISIKSPIAKALIGKKEKDIVEVVVPKGILKIEINDIYYE